MARRRRRRRTGYDDDHDDSFYNDENEDEYEDDSYSYRPISNNEKQSQRPAASSRRPSQPPRKRYQSECDDDFHDEPSYSRNRNQYEEEDDDYYDSQDKDYGDDYFEDYYDSGVQDEDGSNNKRLEWEEFKCNAGTAQILLPPLAVSKPTTILHFVGGTGFGSFPHVWYARLLQELVQHSNAAVIATSIPITVGSLWGSGGGGRESSSQSSTSPLNHVALAKKLKQQFQMAYQEVLVDEYGSEALKNVPICGLGHSLGARLLAVLATLSSSKQQSRKARRNLDYKALILISFTNYGAAAGIPGIGQLSKASRKIQKREDAKRQREEERRRRSRNARSKRRYREDDEEDYYNSSYDKYDDDEDDDEDYEDLGELFDDVKELVQEQASQLQVALTPSSEDLEFYPSPTQLWKALTLDRRYVVPETLVVQFDSDEIDQSAKLADCLASLQQQKTKEDPEPTLKATLNGDNQEAAAATSTADTTTTTTAPQQVYFSRIRGNHLTPVLLEPQNKKRGGRNNNNNNNNNRVSKYDYKLYAFVHEDGRSCAPYLKRFRYHIVPSHIPWNISDVRDPRLRHGIQQGKGCCGRGKEFIKLQTLTLTRHPVAVHLDVDTLVLQPLDVLFDALLMASGHDTVAEYNTSLFPYVQQHIPLEQQQPQRSSRVVTHQEDEGPVQTLFTRDYPLAPPHVPPHKVGMQAGFWVVRPNTTAYHDILHMIVVTGRWNQGWYDDDDHFPLHYGSLRISGTLNWYYSHYHPHQMVELNRCHFNTMVDDARLPFCNSNGNSNDNNDACQDCRTTDPSEVYSAHFTSFCGKPWECPREFGPGRERLCSYLHRKWHETRELLVMKERLPQQRVASSFNANRHGTTTAHGYYGHCQDTTYIPMLA